MKLHGHTILELTDQHTGQVERVEKDNLVTQAASTILTSLGGFVGLNSVYWNSAYGEARLAQSLFGGLLLLDRTQGSNDNTLFMSKGTTVTGSARCGTTNSGANIHRGSYNASESSLDWENGVLKFVYDFTTSQANGTIASICLTSLDGAAYTEDENSGEALAYLGNSNFGLGSGDCGQYAGDIRSEYGGKYGKLLEWNSETQQALFAKLDDTAMTVTVTKMKLYLKQLDLFAPVLGDERTPTEQNTVDVSGAIRNNTDGQKRYNRLCYDHELHRLYLVCCSTSTPVNGTVTVMEINPDTMETQTYTYTNNTGVELLAAMYDGFLNTSSSARGYEHLGGSLNGTVYEGWLYLLNKNSDRLYRVKLSDLSSVADCGANTFTEIGSIHNGRFYAENKVFNTQTLQWSFNELGIKTYTGNRWNAPRATVNIRTSPVMPKGIWLIGRSARELNLQPDFLATINDLGTAVTKTNDKSMKVTYILQRTEES